MLAWFAVLLVSSARANFGSGGPYYGNYGGYGRGYNKYGYGDNSYGGHKVNQYTGGYGFTGGYESHEVKGLKNDVQLLHNNNKDLQKKNKDLQSQVDNLKHNLKTLKNGFSFLLNKLKTELGTVDSRLKTAEGDVVDVKGGLTTAEGNIEDLQIDLTTAEGNIEGLQIDLTTAEKDIEDLQIDLATAEENIDDLQEQMETIVSTPKIQKSSAYCGIQSDIGYSEGTKLNNGIITYEEITSNVEGDENSFSLNLETGIFTVNKDGVYSFSASAVSAHTDNDAYLKISLKTSEINQDEKESNLMSLFSDSTTKLKRSLFGTRLVDMKEGDEFSLEYDCNEGNGGSCGIEKLYSCVMMIETEGTCGFQDRVQGVNGLVEVDDEGNTERIIIYDQTSQNLLSESTGRFTADQTGVYSVSVSAFVGHITLNGDLYVYLRTSSGNYQTDGQGDLFNLDSSTSIDNIRTSISATRMLTLNEGEQLWLKYKCNGNAGTDCAIESLHFCIFFVGQKEDVSTNDVAVNGNEMENTEVAYCGFNGGVSDDSVIWYDQVFDELGTDSLLDKVSGIFTAGVAGTYQVSVYAQYGRTVDDAEIQVYLKTDSMTNQGDDQDLLLNQQGDGTDFLYAPLSASRLVTLELNEQLWLEYKCTPAEDCSLQDITTCIYLVPQLVE